MDFYWRGKKFKFTLITAVIASLLIHFVMVGGVYLFKPPQVNNDRIEVQILDQKTMPKLKNSIKDAAKQVVDQADKAINNEIDDQAKYLSAHNQKVEKQTRATNYGNFQNTASKSNIAGQGGSPKKMDIKKFSPEFDVSKLIHDREIREQKFENDPTAIKVATEKSQPKPTPESSAQAGPGGEKVSQTVDYIKDLDPGLETLLSTREFIYYTYYARIRRQLNQFWGPKVKEKMMLLYKQGRQIASSEDKITRCLVTLDKKGNLTRVQIIGISGVMELDEAAVDAFKSAAPFPNPPTGIVDEDGSIKIRWDFILEV